MCSAQCLQVLVGAGVPSPSPPQPCLPTTPCLSDLLSLWFPVSGGLQIKKYFFLLLGSLHSVSFGLFSTSGEVPNQNVIGFPKLCETFLFFTR